MNGLGNGDGMPKPAVLARYMSDSDKLASLLQDEIGGQGASPAAMLADIINQERADCKRLAGVHGVEMEIERVTEERAADMIAGITDGEGVELVQVFNELARKRARVLAAALEREEFERFEQQKTAGMITGDPVAWDYQEVRDVDE